MKKIICFIICVFVFFSTISVGAVTEDEKGEDPRRSEWYDFVIERSTYMLDQIGIDGEAYTLTVNRAWGDDGFMVLYQENGSTKFAVIEETYGDLRVKRRTLTEEEYNEFTRYIDESEADTLTHWTPAIADGTTYTYTHINGGINAVVYMNNPRVSSNSGSYVVFYSSEDEDDSAYVALVERFLKLASRGEFETAYLRSGAEILVNRDEYNVVNVWKNGDDFRVCVKEDDRLVWRSLANGALGEIVSEPEDITLQDAWSDFPEGQLNSERHFNTYPWRCSWRDYRIRAMSSMYRGKKTSGLWLSRKGTSPKLIHSGNYNSPVVYKNYVFCEKAVNGWASPRVLVMIDISSGDETVLDFEPAKNIRPEFVLGDEILIYSYRDDVKTDYLYNPTTGVIRVIDGCVPYVSKSDSRFLQSAAEKNTYYYTVPHCGQTTIGKINLEDFRFTPIYEVDLSFFSNEIYWVDEQAGKVYVARDGELLAIDLAEKFNMPKVYSHGWLIDGCEVINDTVMVPLRETVKEKFLIEWNGETKSASVSTGEGESDFVAFVVGSAVANNNGEECSMPEAAYIDSNGRLMVPLEFLVEKLALQITRYDDGAVNIYVRPQ